MNISMEKLGRNIRMQREKRGMSIETLAEQAGTTADYVIKAESGKKKVTLVMALSFCVALGVEPSELLEGIEA